MDRFRENLSDVKAAILWKNHVYSGTELWRNHYEELLRIVISYIINIWEVQYRSRLGRDSGSQGKSKFGKLGRGKSCSVVHGSAWSSGCEVYDPSATATI